MNAGKLDKQILLQSPTSTSDHGETVESWATEATVWAAIEAVSSSESLDGGVNGEINHTVTIRYRSGVKSSWRFLWGTKALNINGPPLEEIIDGSRMLIISCTEKEQ